MVLTISNILKAKVLSFFYRKNNKSSKLRKIIWKNFRLIKDYKTENYGSNVSVGLYKNKNKMIVVKQCKYEYQNLEYLHLMNEIFILKSVRNIKVHTKDNFIVRFPKFVKSINSKNNLTLITQFEKGIPLQKFSVKKKLLVLENCIEAINVIDKKLKKQVKRDFPVRSSFQTAVGFFYFFFKLSLKNLVSLNENIKLFYLFYKNFLTLDRFYDSTRFLNHRDLHSNNIIIKANEIIILDPGFMIMWEKNADIALLPQLYFKEIDPMDIQKVIEKHIISEADKANFIAIQIYDLVLSLSLLNQSSLEYKKYINFKNTTFNFFIKNYEKDHT